MAVKIEDFIGKVGNLDGDIAAYELAKTKENGGKSYTASSDEIIKVVSKYRPGKQKITGLGDEDKQGIGTKILDITKYLLDTQKTQTSQYDSGEMYPINDM